jgi:hypothetical protein
MFRADSRVCLPRKVIGEGYHIKIRHFLGLNIEEGEKIRIEEAGHAHNHPPPHLDQDPDHPPFPSDRSKEAKTPSRSVFACPSCPPSGVNSSCRPSYANR